MKKCITCGIKKSFFDFSKHKNTKDGFNSRCKKCNNENYARWYATPEGRAKHMLTEMKKHSEGKRATLEKTLTMDDILSVIKAGKCQLTNLMFDFKPAKTTFKNPYAPSLDRIDSHKGYTKDNVRVVLSAVNDALGEHTDEEMLPILKAMVKGIEDAQKKSTTSVSTGPDQAGRDDTQSSAIPTTGPGEDSDDTNDYRGATQGENAYRSAKEGSGDSVGHRDTEVGAPQAPTDSQDPGHTESTVSSVEEFFERVRSKSRELDLAAGTASKIRQFGD